MSEQAKIASLLEKIEDARSEARNMGIFSLACFVVAMVGFVLFLGFGGGRAFVALGPLALVILGLAGFVLFSIAEWFYNQTKKRLISELNSMAIQIATCPNCGKELPKGNFELCPFCGKSLREP